MASPKSAPMSIKQALTAALSSGPAQYLGDAHYRPRQQGYFSATQDGTWQSTSNTRTPTTTYSDAPINPKVIRLISWNIDVLVGFAEERMRAALVYLDGLVSSTPADVPIVVFLQEMKLSDLEQIQDSKWIKQRFNITEHDYRNWLGSLYGTTALIDRRLTIKSTFRVPWVSKFVRDGLFVDLALSNTQYSDDPPVRPLQVAAASRYLHKTEVACALLAGDLNAIQPFDRTLHSENALKDTYLELGGQEDSDEGYTWGQQAPQWMREKFGCSRMDKILFRGDVQPKSFERIGMGVKVTEDVREEVEKEIEGGWVTDHYGVMGDFELTGGWGLQSSDGGKGGKTTSKLS